MKRVFFLITALMLTFAIISSSCASDNNHYLDIALCVGRFSAYFKNPSSVNMLQYFYAEAANDAIPYTAFLVDISATNGFGATTTNSYFIILENNGEKFSAIALDGIVSDQEDIRSKNSMYATALSFREGVGDFIVNQLNLDRETFAMYLEGFYYAHYK